MNATKYLVRITVKAIIFITISIIAFTFLNSPILSNELAMTQIENSNELYLMIEVYNKVRPIVSVVYGCITVLLAGATIYDIYEIINTKKNKEEI